MSQSSYSTGADSASTYADTQDRRAINELQDRFVGAIARAKQAGWNETLWSAKRPRGSTRGRGNMYGCVKLIVVPNKHITPVINPVVLSWVPLLVVKSPCCCISLTVPGMLPGAACIFQERGWAGHRSCGAEQNHRRCGEQAACSSVSQQRTKQLQAVAAAGARHRSSSHRTCMQQPFC
jgi:hypothetical protein